MSLFDKLKKDMKIAAIAAGRMSKKTIKATVEAVQEGLNEEEKEAEAEEGKIYLEVKEQQDPEET